MMARTLSTRSSSSTLQSYAGDVCLFLFRALEDGFHDIKKSACACICSLSARAPPSSVEAHAEKLLQALLPNLGHQHSRVRLVVIEALGALVLSGCVPAGLIESLVCPALRPVAYDRTPAVREALFSAVAGWLGGSSVAAPQQLPSKMTAASLLPLLLVGVTDPQPTLAVSALRLVEDVGRAWERGAPAQTLPPTPEGESVPMEGVTEASGSNGAAAGAAGGGDAPAVDRDAEVTSDEEASSVVASQLGPPYDGRPAAGARAMVRDLLPLLMQPLLSEVAEWTVSLRSSASRQLHTVLVFAESGAIPQVCMHLV